jgi:hypothetical protein
MNEPSTTEERQAADMDVDMMTMNLCDETVRDGKRRSRTLTHS